MDNDLFFIFILKTNDKQCMLFISCLLFPLRPKSFGLIFYVVNTFTGGIPFHL
ncbi:hypothetical protein B4086_4891 [Bacillus cereus]|nr:hypothetical protein B4086_4891 [Bacillus cereus]